MRIYYKSRSVPLRLNLITPTNTSHRPFDVSLAMPPTMTTNADPTHYDHSHINGSGNELRTRLIVSELCRGWPVYLDNCEWRNLYSLFTPDASIATSKTPSL
jgi:hypothetical protein